jgi:hypothetical protein
MVAFREVEMEAEARSILREAIQRSGWYPGLSEEMRNRRIEEDVDRNWPLMLADARKRLERFRRL